MWHTNTFRRILLGLCAWPIFLLSAFPGRAATQLGPPLITNFLPREYNFGPQNWSIVQDSRGLIYLGNNDGLLIFDGKNWQSIIMTSTCRSLAIDDHDTIYAGLVGDFGFMAFDTSGQMVYKSLLDQVPVPARKFLDVWRILATSQGVYFITFKNVFRWFDNRITVLDFSGSYPIAFTELYGQVFFAERDEGIAFYNGDQPVKLPYSEEFKAESSGHIFLFSYSDQQILIVTENRGFFIYDLKRVLDKQGRLISPLPPASSVLNKLPSQLDGYFKYYKLYAGIRISDDRLALGTIGSGIIILDNQGRLISVIGKKQGLADNTVRYLFLDREKNLWAALSIGISYIEISSPFRQFSESAGLSGVVLAVTESDKKIYTGSYFGIYYLPDQAQKIGTDGRSFLPLFEEIYQCFDLMPFKNSLIGFMNYYLIQVRDHRLINKIPLGNVGFCLSGSKKFPDHLFVGLNGGLAAFKFRPGDQQLIKEGNFDRISGVVRKIVADQNGDLWVCTSDLKLFYLKFDGKNIVEFSLKRFELNLTHSSCIDLIDDKIIIHTTAGVYQAVIPRGDRFRTDDVKLVPEGTFGKFFRDQNIPVIRAQDDGQKRIWTWTAPEFGCLIRNDKGRYDWNPVPFRRIPRRIENIFSEENGIIWLATTEGEGLFRYDPGMTKNYQVKYPALIREVIVNKDASIMKGNYYLPGSREKDYFRRVSLDQPADMVPKLKYQENSLIFHYAAPFYEKISANLFSYQLVGIDRNWSKWENEGKKEYTNIPEGDYIFRVKARNVFEVESSVAQFRFSIAPPWQRTIYGYVGYVILFLLLMYAGIRLNTRRLLASKERLEKIVAERTQELVVKNQEISQQKDEISRQKEEVETYANDLYSTNRQLTEARNALWGEMELAKKIQTVLLPQKPAIPGYDIAAYMKPADEVGGDYYDVINIDHGNGGAIHEQGRVDPAPTGQHWIVIGDVSGHGVPAGLVMMMAQTAIHAVLQERPDSSPEKILRTVNRVIHENIKKLGEDKYMTITLMSVQADGALYFSGLHQDIMIYRTAKKEVELIETQGMWIGIMDNIEGMVGVDQLTLEPGDTMLLFTDGIVEAVNAQGKMFSTEHLARIFQNLGPRPTDEIRAGILTALTEYACQDDVTLLLLKRIPR